MHLRLLALPLCAFLSLSFGTAEADSLKIAATSPVEAAEISGANSNDYHGFVVDLSEVAKRPDFQQLADGLQRQIDIVESIGLSDRVLTFFRTVPILVDERACMEMREEYAKTHAAGCFNPTTIPSGQHSTKHGSVWDSEKGQYVNEDPFALALDMHVGVITIRPGVASSDRLNRRDPFLLHELLHAYHHNILPEREANPVIKSFFEKAKAKYNSGSYLLTNEQEFFAVTASVFLYGKDRVSGMDEEFTRATLKEKQPDYYEHLVWLFGFDPERRQSPSPLASAQ